MLLAALTLMVAPCGLTAQPAEKVSIGQLPAPGQTIRVKTTQDVNMEMTMVGLPPGGGTPPGPMKSLGTMVFEGTQRVTGPDADGRLSVDLNYDRISAGLTMNGRPVPSLNALDTLKGKTFTIVVDAQGKVVDFKFPDNVTAIAPTLKEMMTAMMDGGPTISIAVGETITVPLNFTLTATMPGAPPMSMVGERTFTLLSIARVDGERIASLEYRLAAKRIAMAMPGPDGPGTMLADFSTTGIGTTQWNLDRGYLVSSDLTSTTDGTMTGPIGMTIHGTIRIVTEGSPSP
ncbi:MAG: hypothetical protein ABI868_02135 [Acidobacteriota bacterium]